MFVIRNHNTSTLSREQLLGRMEATTEYMYQNCDGDSVLYAYHRLAARKEKRKLLIVLSDGSPASSRGGDVDAFTRKVVTGIQDGKQVQIVGIGICDRNVSRIYKEHYVINRADEIETALLKVIEKKIL